MLELIGKEVYHFKTEKFLTVSKLEVETDLFSCDRLISVYTLTDFKKIRLRASSDDFCLREDYVEKRRDRLLTELKDIHRRLDSLEKLK